MNIAPPPPALFVMAALLAWPLLQIASLLTTGMRLQKLAWHLLFERKRASPSRVPKHLLNLEIEGPLPSLGTIAGWVIVVGFIVFLQFEVFQDNPVDRVIETIRHFHSDVDGGV